MTDSIRNIANRAKGLAPGEVTPWEIDVARNILANRSGDIYAALQVVGLLGRESDEDLIKRFLSGVENNRYAEAALKALCRYLGLVAKYRPLLKSLVMNPPTDNGVRRMTALSLMKEYFEDYRDDELGCYLVKILFDVDDPHRRSARDSLVDILKVRSLLKDERGLDLNDWDEDMDLLVDVARRKFNCFEGDFRAFP